MAKLVPFTYSLKDGKQIVFRNLTAEDGESFLQFREQIGHDSTNTMHYVGMSFPSIEFIKKQLAFQEEDRITLNAGAFDGAKLVGYLNFRLTWKEHPWVQHLAEFGMMVSKEYWGQGIAKKLLAIQDTHAQSCGVTRIEAVVRAKNDRAIQLYKNCGFIIEGTRKWGAKIDGELLDDYYIAKIFEDPNSNPRWEPPTLTTNRLILRPIQLSDAESIFNYAQNPKVSLFTLWEPHQSVKDSQAYIRDYIWEHYKEGMPEPLGIAFKDQPQKLIGTIGCFWVSQKAKSMELAYAIAEEHWGKGIVPEAAQVVMDYAFKEFDLKRIQARCKAENKASSRVMEKIGMHYEGTLKSAIFHRERFWDILHYAKIKD